MRHLTNQIAEYVFGDLSPSDLADAKRHLGDCADCRQGVEQFQRIQAMLKTLPDVDPPRQLVFEFEKRRFLAGWVSRWLAPMASAAAVAFTVVTLSRGPVVEPPQAAPGVVGQRSVQQTAVEPVDYDRIIQEVRDSQQAWFVNELQERDQAQIKEIQRLRAEIAYLESLQLTMRRETIENASSIQLLAHGSPPRE